MNRFLGRLTRTVKSPSRCTRSGSLFGLGFDTATEVALLVLAGGAAGAGLPWYAILCLPLLFAAGMSLMDSIDGSFMNFAYGWAFFKPVRKVFYNITITGLSVAICAGDRHRSSSAGCSPETADCRAAFWDWFEEHQHQPARLRDRRHVRRHLGDRPVRLALRPDRGALERPPGRPSPSERRARAAPRPVGTGG